MAKDIGLDDIAEDIFSLNIRGLKSIVKLWRSPDEYFDAALTPDWNGRFTPSVRLWLSLIALSGLLQFFWIGTDTPLVGAYAQGFRDAGAVLPDGVTIDVLAETTALWVFAVFPFVQLSLFLALLPQVRLWGRKTTYGLRLRYGFAMMTPSASLAVFILPAMTLLPANQVSAFGIGIGILALSIDSATAFRGARPGRTTTGRLIRSVLLAAIVLTMNVVAHMIVQVAGIILTSIQFGVYVP